MHLILFLSPKRVHFSKTTDAWCTMYVFFLSDFAWCSLLLYFMNHSGDNHICGQTKKLSNEHPRWLCQFDKRKSKQNDSKIPPKISGLVCQGLFSILNPWRDICCHGPSEQLTENAKHHPNSLRDQFSSFGWTKGVLRIYFSNTGTGWSIVPIVKMLGSH